jgi:L-alanine-DL-glutamate epimerase-like enolase superfamily enzyme
MEITDIDVFPLEVPEAGGPHSNARATAQFTGSPNIIVRVHTSDDIVGLGETCMTIPGHDNYIETIA